MSKCYAQCLGDCSAKISLEHYISKSLLELSVDENNFVLIDGLVSKDGLRLSTSKAATAHILCEKHNNALSDYDSCFSSLVKDLIDFNRSQDDKTIVLNGEKTTLWLIKTLLGNLAVRKNNEKLHQGQNQFDYLVNILFSRLEFNQSLGFTLAREDPPEKFRRDGGVSPWALEYLSSDGITVGIKAWVNPFSFTFLVPGLNFSELRPLGCLFKVNGSTERTLDFRISW